MAPDRAHGGGRVGDLGDECCARWSVCLSRSEPICLFSSVYSLYAPSITALPPFETHLTSCSLERLLVRAFLRTRAPNCLQNPEHSIMFFAPRSLGASKCCRAGWRESVTFAVQPQTREWWHLTNTVAGSGRAASNADAVVGVCVLANVWMCPERQPRFRDSGLLRNDARVLGSRAAERRKSDGARLT